MPRTPSGRAVCRRIGAIVLVSLLCLGGCGGSHQGGADEYQGYGFDGRVDPPAYVFGTEAALSSTLPRRITVAPNGDVLSPSNNSIRKYADFGKGPMTVFESAPGETGPSVGDYI